MRSASQKKVLKENQTQKPAPLARKPMSQERQGNNTGKNLKLNGIGQKESGLNVKSQKIAGPMSQEKPAQPTNFKARNDKPPMQKPKKPKNDQKEQRPGRKLFTEKNNVSNIVFGDEPQKPKTVGKEAAKPQSQKLEPVAEEIVQMTRKGRVQVQSPPPFAVEIHQKENLGLNQNSEKKKPDPKSNNPLPGALKKNPKVLASKKPPVKNNQARLPVVKTAGAGQNVRKTSKNQVKLPNKLGIKGNKQLRANSEQKKGSEARQEFIKNQLGGQNMKEIFGSN